VFFSNYDAALKNYNDNKDNVPPPPGEYVAIISSAKNNPDANNKSYMLVSFRVEEGEQEGKRVTTRFYYDNEVGAGRLIALAIDAGLKPSAKFDEALLVGKKVVIKVKAYTSKDGNTGVEYHYCKPFNPNAEAPASQQTVPGVPFA